MQKTSTNNKTCSFMRTRINQDFRDNKKIFIVVMLLQLLGLPVMVITSTLALHAEELERIASINHDADFVPPNYAIYYFFLFAGLIAFGFASLSGILTVFRSFSYLYKKSEVDMNYSLPLSAPQRFICDYFSGLFMYVIPYIISLILSFVLLIGGKAVYPELWNTIADNFPDLAYLLILGLFIMIMLYTIITLVLVCCGTLFEAVAYTILTNIIIPVSVFIYYYAIYAKAYGIDFSTECLSLIAYTSPAGALLTAILKFGFDSTMQIDPNILYCRFSVLFLVSCIMFALSYLLYKKRKAEDVSRPFVYRAFYYVFAVMGTACITAGMYANHAPVQGVVTGVVFFFIVSTIANRGLKNVLPSAAVCVVTIGVSLAVPALSNKTNAFGAVEKIPDEKKITSISLWTSDYYGYDINRFTLTDKSEISLVLDMHKKIVDRYITEYDNSDDTTASDYIDWESYRGGTYPFNVTYNLKNGSSIERQYSVEYAFLAENPELWLTDSYARSMSSDIYNLISRAYTDANDLQIGSKYSYNCVSKPVTSESAASDISKAYLEDYSTLSTDALKQMKTYCFIYNTPVPDSFNKTKEALNKYGFVPPEADQDIASLIKMIDEDRPSGREATFTFSDSDYFKEQTDITGDNLSVDGPSSCNAQYILNDKYDEETLRTLLRAAEPMYSTDKKFFIIRTPDIQQMAIPYEYYDMASEFVKTSCHKNE